MTRLDQIAALDEMGVEFAGLIFYPKSPRYIKRFHLSAIDLKREKLQISRVGVFVNETAEEILRVVDEWRLHMVQLHGDESPKFCEQISDHITTIKAFRIGKNENIDWKIHPYRECVDMFLFDTVGVSYGGNGEQFDWKLLEESNIRKPFFLSGGIGPEDGKRVLEFAAGQRDLFSLDVNSRFETAPGIKDISLVRQFVEAIKQ
ncbi:MAG: phosphoribosylanthranilate isomerase [Chitinophagaceae bacterium]|jgi:phosphoribosylanthranilate isomerase|nr:phosphoribosylanthranilate isomerase [Chitinophagaceae bacterium]